MPGATLVDLGAGWKIRPQLELRGQVRNLLNDEYYASPDPRWVLAPGRSASVTAVVQF
jgi:outer membrane receptor protein involved in Fe transport